MDTSIALVTLLVYKVLLLMIGFWSQRRTRNTDDFFLGGRDLGPVVAAISYGASTASAWTLLGMSGAAFVLGLSAFWIVIGAVAGCVVAWLWIAPRLMAHSRQRGQITLTDFLADTAPGRENAGARQLQWLASLVILLSFIFYIAAQFQGAATTFSDTFALPTTSSLLLGASVIAAYTLLGGFTAASITDTLQGALMLFAALLLPLAAFVQLDGWEGISLEGLTATGDLSLTAGNTGLAALGFVLGSLAIGVGTFGQPHLLNRFMALRDTKALKRAQYLSIAWFSLVFVGTFSLGILGRLLLPQLDNPETLFFRLADMLLHPVVAALLLAAVLSAIMSTADSMLLVVASTISHDLGLGRTLPGRELLISRLAMLSVTALAVLIALLLPATIFERVLFAWIAIGSAFGPTVFARLAGAELSPTAVAGSISAGFTLAVTLYLLPNTPGDWAERLLPFAVAAAILFPGLRQTRAGLSSSRA